MADLGERPSKIRKLDPISSDTNGGQEETTVSGLEGFTGEHQTGEGNTLKKESKVSTSDLTGNGELDVAKDSQPLSKSQLKKIRKQEEWEAGRENRKAIRKEKIKEKKTRKIAEKAEVEKERDDVAAPAPVPLNKSHHRSTLVPVTLVLDCDFDELMTDKEIISLASQLTRCYSSNRGASYKAHMVISSFSGQLKQRFETILANHHLGWKGVKFTNDDFIAAAEAADAAMRCSTGGKLAGALAGAESTITTSLQQPEAMFSEPLVEVGDRSEQIIPEWEEQLHRESSMLSRQTPSNYTNPDGISLDAKDIDAETKALEAPYLDQSLESLSAANATGNVLSEMAEGERIHDANFPPQEPTPSDPAEAESRNIWGATCPSGSENNEREGVTRPTPSIIYLTSDSPDTLDVLSPYTSYIIGGLVDKNRHKGICYKHACIRDIPTAKLPISEYMTMQSRSVLATNHVIEIMTRWLEHGDWARAFLEVIPKRKAAKLKMGTSNHNEQKGAETGDAPASHEDTDKEVEKM